MIRALIIFHMLLTASISFAAEDSDIGHIFLHHEHVELDGESFSNVSDIVETASQYNTFVIEPKGCVEQNDLIQLMNELTPLSEGPLTIMDAELKNYGECTQ